MDRREELPFCNIAAADVQRTVSVLERQYISFRAQRRMPTVDDSCHAVRSC